MNNPERNQESRIKDIIDDLFIECRNRKHLFNTQITLDLGGATWNVIYWPENPDIPEALILTRCRTEQEDTTLFYFRPEGYVTKQTPDNLAQGNSSIDVDVSDEDEVLNLKAIVNAAHHLE